MKQAIIILLLFAAITTHAQKEGKAKDYTVIKSSDWIIPKNDTLDFEFSSYVGEKALRLKRTILNYKSASVAYPKNLDFKDGIIELDIASPAGKVGFVGLAFRIQDEHHYETLYFRPGSSNTPNAIQYMPEKKSEFNWWDYEDLKYQAQATLPLTDWFHVKAVVKGNQLTVYLDNKSVPAFTYKALDPNLSHGSVGFWLGNCIAGVYKNLVVKPL